MNWLVVHRQLLWFVLFTLFYCTNSQAQDYDRPVVIPNVDYVKLFPQFHLKDSEKFIPRNVWIAVRNITDGRPGHIPGFIEKNKNWVVHFCDNTCKDDFMERGFAGTSILWAYNILNPAIGCSKVEIWRLCVLYAFGGMYMDDDSNFGSKLDDVVRADDKFIVAEENDYSDHCYVANYSISNDSLNRRFGEANKQIFFNNKFFINWGMFSTPRHPVLLRSLEHAVQLIKAEYFCNSLIKMSKQDHRGKLLMCATTYPITLAARELMLEKIPNLGIRVANHFFEEYGADMKAWYNDNAPNHWVKMIHKHKTPYLREYRPQFLIDIQQLRFEGKLYQVHGDRQVYVILNGSRHGFPDLQTFTSMNFDFDNVEMVSRGILDQIPDGGMLAHRDS